MKKNPRSKYLYVGLFLTEDQAQRIYSHVGGHRLPKTVDSPHVTLAFEPTGAREELFGKLVPFEVIGYGNDGVNEGALVKLGDIDTELLSVASERPTHHITLSLARGGRAVDTGSLPFSPIEPLCLEAPYGGCTRDGTVVLENPHRCSRQCSLRVSASHGFCCNSNK